MMKTVQISLSTLVGGGICVSTSDGQKVHDEIVRHIQDGHRIELSFENVTRMTTAFLNAAVGQLYGEYSEEELRERMSAPVHAEPWHLSRLVLVVRRAKSFFEDADRVERSINRVTGLEA